MKGSNDFIEFSNILSAYVLRELLESLVSVRDPKMFWSPDDEQFSLSYDLPSDCQTESRMEEISCDIGSMIVRRCGAREIQFLDIEQSAHTQYSSKSHCGGVIVNLDGHYDLIRNLIYWRVEIRYLAARVLPKIGDPINVMIPRRFAGNG